MSLWKKYNLERFLSFEEPSFFVSDSGSLGKCVWFDALSKPIPQRDSVLPKTSRKSTPPSPVVITFHH